MNESQKIPVSERRAEQTEIKSIQVETFLICKISAHAAQLINEAKKLRNLSSNVYLQNVASWIETNARNIKTKANGGLQVQ